MKRKLYRLRRDRVVGGVSAGLAEYFSIDTLLVRVIFIVMAFFNGIGIIAYLIMWMVIPENPNETPFVHKKKKKILRKMRLQVSLLHPRMIRLRQSLKRDALFSGGF